jgi:hypothetical protein
MTTRKGFRSFPSPRSRRHPTRHLDRQGLRQPRPRAPFTMRRVASCRDARAGPMGRLGSGSVCFTARKGRGGAAPAGARSPRADRRTLPACSKSGRPRHGISMGHCDLGCRPASSFRPALGWGQTGAGAVFWEAFRLLDGAQPPLGTAVSAGGGASEERTWWSGPCWRVLERQNGACS